MTNDEIGTYQIAEAIKENPKLKVKITNNQLTAKINGIKYIGNLTVLKKCVDTSKLSKRKTIMDNDIVQKKNPKQVFSDVFGVSTNDDKKIVYDIEEIWERAKKLATKTEVKKKKNKFKLDVYDDRGSL